LHQEKDRGAIYILSKIVFCYLKLDSIIREPAKKREIFSALMTY